VRDDAPEKCGDEQPGYAIGLLAIRNCFAAGLQD